MEALTQKQLLERYLQVKEVPEGAGEAAAGAQQAALISIVDGVSLSFQLSRPFDLVLLMKGIMRI